MPPAGFLGVCVHATTRDGTALQALDLFEALLVEKSSVMAEPDLLISSIGTRVYAK